MLRAEALQAKFACQVCCSCLQQCLQCRPSSGQYGSKHVLFHAKKCRLPQNIGVQEDYKQTRLLYIPAGFALCAAATLLRCIIVAFMVLLAASQGLLDSCTARRHLCKGPTKHRSGAGTTQRAGTIAQSDSHQ